MICECQNTDTPKLTYSFSYVKLTQINFCVNKDLTDYTLDVIYNFIYWIELNGIWVQAPTGPLDLGISTGPLCPMFYTKLEEPCSFSKVPYGPYT
jgi:hypothetical protein